MKWFIDLDDTLIDTTRFYVKFCKAVGRLYGINPLNFAARLIKQRQKFDYPVNKRALRPFYTLRSFGVDDDGAEDLLRTELSGNDFLYKDAVVFLDWLKDKKIKPTILTFGDTQTQRFKISLVPRLSNFDVEVVQVPKQDFLKTQKVDRAILVDDRLVTDLPDWCEGVLVARHGSSPKNYSGRVVRTLDKLISSD